MATMKDITFEGWHCYDVGTAKYEVYAPFDVKYKLETQCNLPHTGFNLLPLILLSALVVLCIGLGLRMMFRRR